MKRKIKGSLIIGVTMLGIVLLMFLLMEFQINGANSLQVDNAAERERTLEAANAALTKGVNYIKAHLCSETGMLSYTDDFAKNCYRINLPLTDWETLTSYDGCDAYKYAYKIENGIITAYGKQVKDGKVKFVKKLTANYLVEYMGVTAKQIQYCPGTYQAAGISSIYSYKTQYPMNSWIGIDNAYSQEPCAIKTSGTIAYGSLTSNANIVTQYMLTNPPDFYTNPSKFYETHKPLDPKVLYNNEYREESYIKEIDHMFGLVKALNLNKGRLYYSENGLKLVEIKENLKKDYEYIDDDEIEEQVNEQFKDFSGLPLNQWKNLPDIPGNCMTLVDADSDIWEFNPDEYNNGIKGIITGKNLWMTSLCGVIVCNGDLILSREDPNSTNTNDTNDYNNTYPVLMVGGSLIVNGTIRGTGTVIAMNNIYVSAINSQHNFNDKYKDFNDKFNTSGSLIVHAGNRLIIKNAYSDKQWTADCDDRSAYINGSANINSISNIENINGIEDNITIPKQAESYLYPDIFCSFGFKEIKEPTNRATDVVQVPAERLNEQVPGNNNY